MSQRPIILISGASRGLGAEAAVAAAQLGADLILTARSQEGLEETAGRVKTGTPECQVTVVSGDLASSSFCAELAKRAGEKPLAGLVLNAAMIEPVGLVHTLDDEQWEKAIQVNLNAPFRLAKYCLPLLKKSKGRLITLGTGASATPIASWGAYCTSKCGLKMLTNVIAVENPDIVSMSFGPGVVDTAMQGTIREKKDVMPSELAEYFSGLHSSGQLEPPEVPARGLAWCALHAPAQWTGCELSYDNPELVAQVKKAFAALSSV